MDYNNNYGQGNNNQQPVYNNQPQNGYYQNGAYYNNQPQYGNPYAPNQQMGYQQNTQQNNQIDAMSIPQIAEPVNSAFGKGLAATIMGWFPITSIIAIFLGCGALKNVKEANAIAANYGIQTIGKNVAAKVLGMIGKIVGIVYTVIWGLYFVGIFFMILASIM